MDNNIPILEYSTGDAVYTHSDIDNTTAGILRRLIREKINDEALVRIILVMDNCYLCFVHYKNKLHSDSPLLELQAKVSFERMRDEKLKFFL